MSGAAPIPGQVRALSVSKETASQSTVPEHHAISLLQSVITLADEAPGISDEQLRDRLVALTDWSR